ncbi:hypothetical protein [Limnospira sp. PMC 737.11]|uniref:hypothetical protein n=1 Tax=Limnospira sp. PMC 737.11 TaxID=2981095 RepID=UPI001314C386|nr:hypothetical protein [Limnospira sp. PMC 737.11]
MKHNVSNRLIDTIPQKRSPPKTHLPNSTPVHFGCSPAFPNHTRRNYREKGDRLIFSH